MKEEEIEEYRMLTELCLNETCFEFEGKIYQQKEGLSMGNPLSPFLANLYMSFFETHITETFPWLFKFWVRYVDDILAIVNEKHVEDALKLLNLQEKSIKFTMDMEKDNMLPYLDLKLIRNNNSISFGIYRKDTNTDSYIKKLID